MLHTHRFARAASAATALALILACGGGGSDVAGNHFPLTSSVAVQCVNNDGQNVHILIGGEAFNPPVNRVGPGLTLNRTSPLSYTWDTATDTVTITIFAGRNGVVLDQGNVTLTGQDRMDGKGIRAVWNANQSITVTKQ